MQMLSFRSDPLDPNSLIDCENQDHNFLQELVLHIQFQTEQNFIFLMDIFFRIRNSNILFENNQYDLNVREPLFGQPSLDATRTISYEVGVSHQFSDNVALNITAYYRDITGLIGTRYYFPYVDGRYTGYTLYVNEDYANNKGFEFTLDIRPDKIFFRWFNLYLFMYAKGSASSETGTISGNIKNQLNFIISILTELIFLMQAEHTQFLDDEGPKIFGSPIFENMDLSLILKASSGAPYTPSGRDVGFVEKNSLRQPGVI